MPVTEKRTTQFPNSSGGLPKLTTPAAFKQFSYTLNLVLPEAKPNVAEILKVTAEITVANMRIIKTPRFISEENQISTGKKLMVEGEIIQKLEYAADEPSRARIILFHSMPFSSYIVLTDNCSLVPLAVTGYIEHISGEILDKRTIYQCIQIILVAEF